MRRILYTADIWTRDQVKNDNCHYYLFGDNLLQIGTSGQAIIRGLPNAFGVPTKIKPSIEDNSFFSDERFEGNCHLINQALSKIPNDRALIVNINIGRGLAELNKRAPKTYNFLIGQLGISYLMNWGNDW